MAETIENKIEGNGAQSITSADSSSTPVNTGGDGGFDFLKDGIDKLAAAPKQAFGKNLGPNGNPSANDARPSATAPDGSPIQDSASAPSPSGNYLSDDDLRAEARLWIYGTDLLAAKGLSWYSKIQSTKYFRLDDDESKELEDRLVDYFRTLPEPPKMPAWAGLVMAAIFVYGGKFAEARELRKSIVPEDESEEQSQLNTQKPNTQPSEKKPIVPSKKRAASKKKTAPKFDPEKPYWDQAFDGKFQKVNNPVDFITSEKRKAKGGQLCLNCRTNYCNPGKNTCSQHCSGKQKKKMNGASVV